MRFTFKFISPDHLNDQGLCDVFIDDREIMWSGHIIHVHERYKDLAPLINAYSTLRNKMSMPRNQNDDTLHFMILFTSLILL